MRVAFVCRDIYYYNYPLTARHLKEKFRAETYAITPSTMTASMIEKLCRPLNMEDIATLNISHLKYTSNFIINFIGRKGI